MFLLISAFCFITATVLQTQSGACQKTNEPFSEVIFFNVLGSNNFKRNTHQDIVGKDVLDTSLFGLLFPKNRLFCCCFFEAALAFFDPNLLRKPLNGWQRVSTGPPTYLPDTERSAWHCTCLLGVVELMVRAFGAWPLSLAVRFSVGLNKKIIRDNVEP